MKRLSKLFQSRKLRYGGLASFLTLLLVVVIVAVNVLVTSLADRYSWKLDLTENHIYSLTQTTKDILKSLDQDIRIVALYPEGQDSPLMVDILRRYQNESSHISFETMDPAKNPGFGAEYSSTQLNMTYGGLIVSSGDKDKMIAERDLYSIDMEAQQIDGILAEQAITSAILYVTSDYEVNVAFTTGHDEEGSSGSALDALKSYYQSLNATVSDVNLLTEDVPQNLSMLCIVSPERDFTVEEIAKLDQYLASGGNVQYFAPTLGIELPRLDAYLAEWGIKVHNDYVVDQNANNNANNATILLPNIQNHEITSIFNGRNSRIYFPYTRSIEVQQVMQNITTAPILESSQQSFARRDITSQSVEKIDTDVDGPITVMLAAEQTYSDGKVGKLVIYGTSNVASAQLLADKGYGITDLLSGAFTYLTGEESPIAEVASKSLMAEQLTISVGQIMSVIGVLAVIAIAILVFGIVVWARRRHR